MSSRPDNSIAAVEARAMARYASLTGDRREETIDYCYGLIGGRFGTTSQAARDYAARMLTAMSV